MTKREDIFIQILIVCGEENQHLSARERTKKNAAQTSDASLGKYRSFRAVFTGNASVVEETCALTFCLFFNTKSMQGEKIFLYSEFGGVLLYSPEKRGNEKKESTPAARGERENGGGLERQRGERRTIEARRRTSAVVFENT